MFTVGPAFWVSAAAAAGCDVYWTNVKTLLHFDGDLSDESLSAVTYTADGGAVIAASGQLYGTGMLDPTAGTSARASGTSSDLGLGTDDFCIECWFKDTDEPGKNQYVWLFEATGTGHTVRIYSPSAGNISADASGGGPVGSVAYSLNAWHHIAVTRSGNDWSMWLDGEQEQSWTNNTFNGGAGGQLWIGAGSSAGSGLMALIDEFRFTAGVPRYTAPFTPAGPFDNVACSVAPVVLLHFDAANGSTIYTDEAGNSWDSDTPPFDPAEISTAQWKFGGSSLDLSNDLIYTNPFVGPFQADVDLTGDFTVEGWVYMTSGAGYISLFNLFAVFTGQITVNFNGTTLEMYFDPSATYIDITGAGFVGQWVHWFVGRSGNTGLVGLNGLIESGAVSGTPATTEQISIGDPGGAPAYVDEFRVTNGTCLYTGATYTVPTEAFPNS